MKLAYNYELSPYIISWYYNNLINKIENYANLIIKVSDVIARIDVAQSWSNYSIKYNAVRPTLLKNQDLKHVLEMFLK